MSAGYASALRRAAGISLRALCSAEPSAGGRALVACQSGCVEGVSFQRRDCSAGGAAAQVLGSARRAGGPRLFSSLQAEAAAEPRQATYHIDIITGDVRGAGSPAPAAITLFGEGEPSGAASPARRLRAGVRLLLAAPLPAHPPTPPPPPPPTTPHPPPLARADGESESHVIGAEEADAGFERATHKTYAVYSRDLGRLRRVLVQQLAPTEGEAESGEPATGWYLDRVEVRGPEGERWTFPCGSWLGVAPACEGGEGGGGGGGVAGCVERNLIPADHSRDVHASSLHDPSARRLTRPLRVDAAGFAVPHPEKVAAGVKGLNRKGYGTGGEDSYFYAANRNGVFAAGVADGIYMWRDKGVDAGAFSRQLVEFCRQAVELGTTDVLRVLQFADRHLRRAAAQGSSTACLVLVDTLAGRLAAANVGDSGFALLGYRPDARGQGGDKCSSGRGRLVMRYRSPQQEHSFGHPYQLGSHPGADAPEDAMLSTMPAYPGDVVVVGSDGLWDNLSDEEVVATVEAALLEGQPPSAVAQALGFAAFAASVDRRRETPYSRGASAAFDMVYDGGKSDDITVLAMVLA